MSKVPMEKQFNLSKVVNILLSELTYQDMVNNIDIFQSVIPQTDMTSTDLLSQMIPTSEPSYIPKKLEIKLIY